jgi:large subunit ribosomal protein L30
MTEKKHKKAAGKAAGTLRLRWFRSAIQAPEKHKRVVRGLGFTRLNQVVEREDTPSIRGMVNKVPHLIEIVNEAN